MASPAAVLQILVTANTAQATTALTKTDAQLKKTTTSANAASTSLASRLAPAAKMAGAAAGVALVYGLGKAVSVGAEFEKQMDAVGAVSNASGKEMKKLEKQALSLGQKTKFSAMEVAEAQEELVKGGLKVKDVIGGALPAALSLAAAGELELADASATTVNAMKLFGLRAKDASSIADMLATAANKTTGDVEDFSVALKQGGAVAKLAGLNMNQTVVALEALAESGVKNSDAGTSMKTAFIQLLKPTEKQAALADQLNLSFVNQAGNMKNMATLSADLIKATDGMTNAQRAATFATLAGTDGVRTLNALYAAGPEALKKYADANRENGTANEIAREKMDNLSGSMEQLGGAVQTLAIKFSGLVNPAIRSAVDWLTGALTDLSKLNMRELMKDEDIRGVVEAFVALGNAVKTWWDKITLPILEKAAPYIKQYFGGLARVIGGFVEVIAGILSLDFKMALDGMKNIVKGAFDEVIGLLGVVTAPIRHAFAKIGGLAAQAFKTPVQAVVKVVGWVFDKVMGTFSSFLRVAAAAADKLSGIPLIGDKFDGLADAATGAADKIDGFRDSLKGDDNAIKKESESLQDLAKVFKGLGGDVKDTADKIADQVDKIVKNFDRTSDKSKTMGQKVGASITDLARTVTGGLSTIAENTNKALQGFGVKKLAFSFKTVGGAAKGFQKGGVMVPGQGDGDKVPAMLEPGEVVWNKKAVAAMGGAQRVNSINQKIPRFQKGGKVGGMSAMLGLVNKYERASYPYLWGGGHGGFVNASSPVDCSGFVSDVLHAGGLLNGAPMVSRSLMNWGKPASGNEPLVVYANPGHTVMSLNGRVAGTSGSNPGGGAGWIEGGNGASLAPGAKRTMDVVGGIAAKIARILLKGPNGPLKNIGQAALDKTRAAANAYLSKQMPMGTGGGADLGDLPKALMKYNKQYAEAPAPSHLSAPKMPFNAVAAAAEWAGMPGVSMAKTAIGESALAPGASGIDPGGTKGLGLWMITTGFNDALIKKLGGQNAMFNPLINAQAANSIFDSQGIGAWYSSTKDSSNTHYNGPLLKQAGGIIQKFAKGTKGGGGKGHGGKGKGGKGNGLQASVSGGKTDSAWKRFNKARNIAQKLKDILGEKGEVARIDEFISMAETLSGLDSSPSGSDLSPAELTNQIELNENLLKVMEKARKMIGDGMGLLNFPKKMSTAALTTTQIKNLKTTFGGYLSGLTGVTGKGGRIFETQVHLDELRNYSSSPAGPVGMDISGLRSVIEASRYGAFDGMFAKGGSIRPGHWGIAGEAGPEVVHGPATVTPLASGVNIQTSIDFDGLDAIVTHTVNGQIAKRERHHHRQARSYA